ncbi:uncharacterized protein LOC133905322 [Phragmites australis]|uniref:uncharacterized protein LOC133905322 n=1 Tax=Phragmites australis TaxID=29695 RepID=UPI002D7A2F94|nr:uncharacterized protein LOC133905322 [Phragmites australis]
MPPTTKQLQLAAASPTLPSPPSSPVRRADEEDEARQLVMGRWRSSLASGLRAALACTIVGLFSLYAPPALRRHITFPAFSYVVTVIIVTDATLGTALRAAVSALQATFMGAVPSVLALWLAHRTGAAESVLATSAVVALTTFAVALPESAGPVAKRIALGQIIIIYVAKFQQGVHPTGAFALLHPANVVACTALGVAAALLAVLVPWPRLATREARDKSREYKVLAAERVRVMVDAFFFMVANEASAICSRQRRWRMAACMSEAKRLASASTALLHRINAIKEDLQWERAAEVSINMEMEMPLTGMQIALAMQTAGAGSSSGGGGNIDIGPVMTMRDQIRLALLEPNKSSSKPKSLYFYLPMMSSSKRSEELAPFLFLFSLYELHRATSSPIIKAAAAAAKQLVSLDEQLTDLSDEQEEVNLEDDPRLVGRGEDKAHNCSETTKHHQNVLLQSLLGPKGIGRSRLMAAAKCGFSLGLGVLLGLLFSNDHGFWSGLIVATTMSTGRDSTWAVAIARAHGTALGSVYAVLGCLLLSQQQLLTMDLRFLAILPWMLLATFLKRSRAYGPAGGVAAALSVVIIMGRRYDEPPMAFTIARLVETFLGISCAVLADLVFQPGARPSVQAREQLTGCIASLAGCFAPNLSQSQLRVKVVQQQLALLRKHAAQAGSEPTYLWLPPFPTACYDKIEGSMSRMAQLLHVYLQARAALMDMDVDAGGDDDFNRVVSTSLNYCTMLAANSSSLVQEEEDHAKAHDDPEAGHGTIRCCREEEAMAPEEVVGSFLVHAREVLLDEEEEEAEGEEERGLLACCVASIGLCMGEITKEALRLEAHILDLKLLQPQ